MRWRPTLPPAKLDLNNASSLTLANYLLEKDPLRAGTDASQRYGALAQAIVDYRDKTKGGVLSSMDELKSRGRSRGRGRSAGRFLSL